VLWLVIWLVAVLQWENLERFLNEQQHDQGAEVPKKKRY